MKMKIVVAQLNNIVGDIQGNVDKVIQALSCLLYTSDAADE